MTAEQAGRGGEHWLDQMPDGGAGVGQGGGSELGPAARAHAAAVTKERSRAQVSERSLSLLAGESTAPAGGGGRAGGRKSQGAMPGPMSPQSAADLVGSLLPPRKSASVNPLQQQQQQQQQQPRQDLRFDEDQAAVDAMAAEEAEIAALEAELAAVQDTLGEGYRP